MERVARGDAFGPAKDGGVRVVRTDGPNAPTSKEYAEDFNEVTSIGSLTSTTRTADQTTAAIFWQSQSGGLFGGFQPVD